MPFPKSIVYRLSSKVRKLFLVTFFLFLVSFLSGCSVLGVSKPAALQITTTPEASVFIDGKHIGKTPFFSDQLKNKDYLIKITSGEASHTENILLTQGTLTVINWELNNNFLAQSGEILSLKKGEKGLFVSSMPNKTSLELDGKHIGKTPIKIENIEEGEHKLTLSKAGFLDREFSIKTSKDYLLEANVTLASEIAKGTVEAPAPLPVFEFAQIQTTPLGFLRVRKEPSLSSQEVGRVDTGEKVEIIQETEDWMLVKFEDKQGWISSQYAKKLP
jgi:uncharacterized protein YgiM (DUF1202 family)